MLGFLIRLDTTRPSQRAASLCLPLSVHAAREGPSPRAQVSSLPALPWPSPGPVCAPWGVGTQMPGPDGPHSFCIGCGVPWRTHIALTRACIPQWQDITHQMSSVSNEGVFICAQLAGGVEKHCKLPLPRLLPKSWKLRRLVEVHGACAARNNPNCGRCGGGGAD